MVSQLEAVPADVWDPPEPPPLDPRIGLTGVAEEAAAPQPETPGREEPPGAEPRGDGQARDASESPERGDRHRRDVRPRNHGGGRPGHPDPPPVEDGDAGSTVPTSTPAPVPPPAPPAPPPVAPPPVAPPAATPEQEPPTPEPAPPPQGHSPGVVQFGP